MMLAVRSSSSIRMTIRDQLRYICQHPELDCDKAVVEQWRTLGATGMVIVDGAIRSISITLSYFKALI